MGMVGSAAVGAALGAVFGIAARSWMRMIAAFPEFTWAGTIAIVGSAAVAGAGIGLVHGARVTGRRSRWRLAALTAVPFLAAPMGLLVFLLAALVGGWVASGRGPLALRAVATVVLAAIPVALLATSEDRELLDPPQVVGGVVGLWVLMAGLALAGREVVARWPRSTAADPRRP